MGFDCTGAGFAGAGALSLRDPPAAYGLTFLGVDAGRAGVCTKKLVEDGSSRGREGDVETVGSDTSGSSLNAPPAAYGLTLGCGLVRVTLKRRPPSPGGGMEPSSSELEEDEASGAREEKLGGSFMMEIVRRRGMRRGADEYG